MSMQETLINLLKITFPEADYSVTRYGNVVVKNIANDGDTIQYGFYFHPDGIRIRRKIDMWCESRYYQLNRNTHIYYKDPNYWPAFKTQAEAALWFAGYMIRNMHKH